MTITALLLVGASILACATVLSCWPRISRAAVLLQAAGSIVIAVGGLMIAASNHTVGSAFTSGIGPAVGVDPLSGYFLGVIGIVAGAALVYSYAYLAGESHPAGIAVSGGIFVLAMIGVIVARDVIGFLVSWELMTLAPAASILLHSRRAESMRAVMIYLVLTHLATAGVWIVMLMLAHTDALSTSGALADHPAWMRSLLAAAALIGFGTKAGLAPLHTWLPRAHPAAPSQMSAMMSGVMIKVALYGLIRTLFFWIDPLPGWVAPTLFTIAAVSCLAGITYAITQRELKRVLAFSSVENVGIISLGLATALLAASAGHTVVASLAFTAAMLHTLNHALFKSLLFLCAGSIQRSVGELNLNRLGGLLRTMPLTGIAFFVGAMSIAGVPPFNGFVSEWLTFQSMLQLAIGGSSGLIVAGVLGSIVLAATAALAVFCFVKVAGLVLLGVHRTPEASAARDVSGWMSVPQLALTAGCIGIGLFPTTVLTALQHVSPYTDAGVGSTIGAVNVAHAGGFKPLALIALLVGIVVVLQIVRGRRGQAAPAPVWVCGQAVTPRLAWTSVGFTKSLRLVLAVVLRPKREVATERAHGAVVDITHEAAVPHLFDQWLFDPVVAAATATGRAMLRIQSGSLRVYLAYLVAVILIALVLVRLTVGG